MSQSDNETRLNDYFFSELRKAISSIYKPSCDQRDAGDPTAFALLGFLVRVAGTWQSICILRRYGDEAVIMNDAGALLRVILDACIQAEYLYDVPAKRAEQASLYLDFQHIDRYRNGINVTKIPSDFGKTMRASEKRPEGEAMLKANFDKHKAKYPGTGWRKPKDPKNVQDDEVRDKWYEGNLWNLASSVKRTGLYTQFLSLLHGCIHSSSLCVKSGPPGLRADFVTHWAGCFAAIVLQLNLGHHSHQLEKEAAEVVERMAAFADKFEPT